MFWVFIAVVAERFFWETLKISLRLFLKPKTHKAKKSVPKRTPGTGQRWT